MGIDAPAADDIAPRRRQRHLAATRHHRPGQQDGGADARAQNGVEIGGANFGRLDFQRIRAGPAGLAPTVWMSSTNASTSRMRGTLVSSTAPGSEGQPR